MKLPNYVITEAELRKQLKLDIKECPSELAWAKENGITPQSVSAFRRKTQGPGLKIPALLGYKPQIVYIPLDAETISTANPPRRPTANPSTKVDHTKPPLEKKAVDPKVAKEERIQQLRDKHKPQAEQAVVEGKKKKKGKK